MYFVDRFLVQTSFVPNVDDTLDAIADLHLAQLEINPSAVAQCKYCCNILFTHQNTMNPESLSRKGYGLF